MVHHFDWNDGTLEGSVKMLELKLWKSCTDLETIFRMNQDYLTGNLSIHPAHGGPFRLSGKEDFRRGLIEMNEYGMFTFQGQPIVKNELTPTCTYKEPEPGIKPTETEAWCRSCVQSPCYADCQLWSQTRQVPFVQLCLPVEREGTPTAIDAMRLAKSLLKDQRIHTMVSWPKNLQVPNADAEMLWMKADLTAARTHVPKEYLDEYHHYKSVHGSSCTLQIRFARAQREVTRRRFSPVDTQWSEVNDYHLLQPRTPEFFLGRDSGTVVFGVNVSVRHPEKHRAPYIILQHARALGFGKAFAMMPQSDSRVEWSNAGVETVKEGITNDMEDSEDVEVNRQLEDVAIRVFNWVMAGED